MNAVLRSIKGTFETALVLLPWEITFEADQEWFSAGDQHHGVFVLCDGERIGYQRSWFPWNIFTEPRHWCISWHVFHDEQEGLAAAEVFGGSLVGDPYDDQAWYLEFSGEDQLDRLAAYTKIFTSTQPQITRATYETI